MKYSKLIRDKIPEIITRNGATAVTHSASENEYWGKLVEKLQEEVDEFRKDFNEEELADILEVVYAIGEYKGVSKEKLESIRLKKQEERGGFEKRIILDETREPGTPETLATQGRDLEFLYEIGSLRNLDRGWKQHLAIPCASVLEHTMRLVWIALIIARREKAVVDENKIIKMALAHDLAEARVSDLSYVQKVYVTANEVEAVKDLFGGTILEDYEEIVREFETRSSLEARIVKDADNLDLDIELKEIEEQGSELPKKWAANRRMMREEKLYTESAKQMWDEIQSSDPASWHLATNKWSRIPNAGK